MRGLNAVVSNEEGDFEERPLTAVFSVSLVWLAVDTLAVGNTQELSHRNMVDSCVYSTSKSDER